MAKTIEGKYLILTENMNRHELKKMREQISFICPQCHEKVILKVGDFVIPHFAHQRNSSCQNLFSEGESADHLLGKQQLYEFFRQTKQVDVYVEPYLKQLAQRPDLLVTTDIDVIPIEFQCSRLSLSRMSKRTEGYRNAGMNPIWILRTPKKLQQLPQGVISYSLSHFDESFLTYTEPEGSVLLTYNPQTKKFHYLSSLLHITGRQFIGNHRVLSIEKQCFPFARPKSLTTQELNDYYHIYSTSRKNFLRSIIFNNRKGINHPFLRQCYELKIIPSELPAWVGIPVSVQNPFRTHLCEWQMAFIFFVNNQQIRFRDVSSQLIVDFVQQYGGGIKEEIKACQKYLEFLLDLGVDFREGLEFGEIQRIENHFIQYLQNEMKIEKI